jgi:hypothetical protein
MKLGYLVAIAGAGVVLSTSLGACGGFSDIGEGVGQGGEGGDGMGPIEPMGGSQTMTGGSSSVGGSHTMTGGSNAMGGSHTMTGGSSSVGGSQTMTGGSNAMGGSQTMTGGSSSVGGSSTMLECESADDCPQPPPMCLMCLGGVSACPAATCDMGTCGISQAVCPEETACLGRSCGDRCSTSALTPSMMGGGVALPQACDAAGRCVALGDASNLGCIPLGEYPCMGDETPGCPPVVDPYCLDCGDGTESCSEKVCANNRCEYKSNSCAEPGTCTTDADCSIIAADCLSCGDDGIDGCVKYACLEGACAPVCQTKAPCDTEADCPMHSGNNVCTPGPWICKLHECALEEHCPL